LNPAPWLKRRQGPLRKPDEHLMKVKKGRPTNREEKVALNLDRIRQVEREIAEAPPDADMRRLRSRLAAYKGARSVLLNGHR
jgi:hypothetical protein